jgi:hypothetical protein
MCLANNYFNGILPKTLFKVVDTNNRTLLYPQEKIEITESWQSADNQQLRFANGYGTYTSGFHCYLCKADAHARCFQSNTVIEVEYEGINAVGDDISGYKTAVVNKIRLVVPLTAKIGDYLLCKDGEIWLITGQINYAGWNVGAVRVKGKAIGVVADTAKILVTRRDSQLSKAELTQIWLNFNNAKKLPKPMIVENQEQFDEAMRQMSENC